MDDRKKAIHIIRWHRIDICIFIHWIYTAYQATQAKSYWLNLYSFLYRFFLLTRNKFVYQLRLDIYYVRVKSSV